MNGLCELCGAKGDVAVGLVRWTTPPADVLPFASMLRCRDRVACRRAHGEPWPVDDSAMSVRAERVRAALGRLP